MGEVIADTLGRDLKTCAVYGREGITGERDPNTIGFAAVRGGDAVGDPPCCLPPWAGVKSANKASSRATFANGAVRRPLAGRQNPTVCSTCGTCCNQQTQLADAHTALPAALREAPCCFGRSSGHMNQVYYAFACRRFAGSASALSDLPP